MKANSSVLRRTALAGLCILFAATAASCGRQDNKVASSATPAALQPLDILIDWQAEPTYLGIYYAVSKGYLKDAGYDAKVTQSWGANPAVAAVAAGKHLIGTASGGATVLGRNNGADVVSLGVLYPRIPSVVYGLATSGIKRPADLKGKRVGIYPGSITNNEFDAFMKLNGLAPSDVKIVSLSGADIPILLAKKVDAVLEYTEMSPVQVETNASIPGKSGEKTYELKLADYGVGGYGLNIIANTGAMKSQGAQLRKAAAAMARGYKDACANRADAVRTFLAQFPDKDPTYVKTSWDRVCALVGGDPGAQDAKGWQQTIDLYRSLNLLKTDVSPAQIMGQ